MIENCNKDIKLGEISDERKIKIIELINKYQRICMTGDKRLGKTNIVKHGIYLENEQPIAQKNDQGKEVVIAYASKSLSPAEKNYAITEQECLAVIFGIKHFHKYLIDRSFTVITDHSALKGFLNDKRPKGRRARWLMEVQQYNFTIQHRPGKENKNADFLSKI